MLLTVFVKKSFNFSTVVEFSMKVYFTLLYLKVLKKLIRKIFHWFNYYFMTCASKQEIEFDFPTHIEA